MLFTGKDSLFPNQAGTLKIIPQNQDDLFFLYDKLISTADKISTSTSRKITSLDSGIKKKPSRISLNLEIKITTIYPFESSASSLRVKGNCTLNTNDVKTGTSHTLELELNKEFSLTKVKWESKHISAINQPREPCKVLSEKAAETKLTMFNDIFGQWPDRVCYGFKNIKAAHESNAIKTLMITDDLLRSCDALTRRKYTELVDSVKGAGGDVAVFPGKHEKLTVMTGVSAILRFPLPFLDDYGVAD